MTRRKTLRVTLEPRWMPTIAHRLLTDRGLEPAFGSVPAQDAALYWVDRDMTTLAADTADDEAGFDGVTDAQPPEPFGLLVWEGGIPLSVERPFLTSHRLPVRIAGAFWQAADEGLRLMPLTADPRLTGSRLFEGLNTPLVPASILVSVAQLRDGHRSAGRAMIAERTALERIVRATWALSRQPHVAADRDARWDERRDGGRPRAVAALDRTVHYVYLRPSPPSDGAGRPTGEGGPREYSCRWIVRGHYRDQACGERWTQRKRIWIAPCVKGPEDKPLRRGVVHRWNMPRGED